jgi:hypothetical protein
VVSDICELGELCFYIAILLGGGREEKMRQQDVYTFSPRIPLLLEGGTVKVMPAKHRYAKL